jgi:hypothetical protein
MADQTLTTALQQCRDNLIVLSQRALSVSVGTYAYIESRPNAYPVIEFKVTGGNRTKTSTTQQTYNVNLYMKITCAEFKQGFEGQAQDLAEFTYLPTVLQYFEEHGELNILPANPTPPYLDIVNTGISNFQAVTQENKINIILNWLLVFNTSFLRC